MLHTHAYMCGAHAPAWDNSRYMHVLGPCVLRSGGVPVCTYTYEGYDSCF